MNKMLEISIWAGLICLGMGPSAAQTLRDYSNLVFYQLNTSHGLSDNYIRDLAIDSTGNLWVCTGDGLNMYNGKSVVKYSQSEYSQITNDDVRQIICDGRNQLWFQTSDRNVVIVDDARNLHAVRLRDTSGLLPIRRILDPGDVGVILFAQGDHYKLKDGIDIAVFDSLTLDQFESFSIAGFDSLHRIGFRQVEKLDGRNYLYVLPDKFFLVDYFARRVVRQYPVAGIFELTLWADRQVLVQDLESLRMKVIDLQTEAISYPFDLLKDQHGLPLSDRVTNADRINADELLLTTQNSGIYIYHFSSNKLFNYKHSASDPGTIVNNAPTVIAAAKNGWVFLGATPNGVSYFKCDAVIGEQSVFIEDSGYGYDGAIGCIVPRSGDVYYFGVTNHLIKWKRSTNKTWFVRVKENAPDPQMSTPLGLTIDPHDHLWVSTREGIYILNEDDKLIRHILSPNHGEVSSEHRIREMVPGPNNEMWCATDAGISRIDMQTFEVRRFQGNKLDSLNRTYVHNLFFEDDDHLWVGTSGKGAWYYTILTDEVEYFNTATGLISDYVFCINQDRNGTTYFGTNTGLEMRSANGISKRVTVDDGLLHERVEALLLDNENRMWLGNDVGLACYNTIDSTLRVFDERYGLSVYGFRLNSYAQNADDELIWGTERGIQYFYPNQLVAQKASLPTSINRIETRDVVRNLARDAAFQLSHANNYVTFYFTSTDFSKHIRTFYQYKLEGLDPDWIKVKDQNSVRYSAIPPGEYMFRVRASNDDIVWEDATNTVSIIIARPFWMTAWFRLILAGAIGSAVWAVVLWLRKKQSRRHEELETQVVINYFASRINSYRKTEDLLWDVAENCISRLQFEDCVIYLLDPERGILVQKAAFGPKMDKETLNGRVDFSVHRPIEIPLGKGIVGTVVQTGKPELVADTSADPRYIIDDVRRASELAVPMIIDDQVIGVIDSEHSRKHFFTQKHLNILSTIAALCANQIQRVRAEEEKQQAMIEVLKNQQKASESRLQSLRLQMNPHFLFNALNSIQQMILANEEMVATRYLSRFSKLLRAILVHSDKELVTLREELEILNLYIDLESVRFKDAFRYEIQCDEDIDEDEVKIPTLLIQPFVENAIWHGLMHKEGERFLSVRFHETDDWLQCIVEDNGIGRSKAREMRISGGNNHTSKGIAVSMERVRSMHGLNGRSGSIEIHDLHNGHGEALGTKVEIIVPLGR